jgi:hypothetical protein
LNWPIVHWTFFFQMTCKTCSWRLASTLQDILDSQNIQVEWNSPTSSLWYDSLLKTSRKCYMCALRSLVYEIHVTVKWGNIVLSNISYHNDIKHIWSILDTKCTAGASCAWMIMGYRHDEYCDMLLIPIICNSWVGTAAQEYLLCYPGQSHPDDNVFQWLVQCLYETYGTHKMQVTHRLHRHQPIKLP